MNVRVDIERNLLLLVLERCEEACNIARYEVLSIDPFLIAEIGLAREWGRIGSRGRRLVELHGTLQLAGEGTGQVARQKEATQILPQALEPPLGKSLSPIGASRYAQASEDHVLESRLGDP